MPTNRIVPNAPSPFLLLFRNAGPEVHAPLTQAHRGELSKAWNDWYQQLESAGKVAHGSPLAHEGRMVSGPRGEIVMDGPYAETKEVVGGYLYLTVADLDEATAIARQCPGLAIGITVEVRPIAANSPELPEVIGRPARAS